MNNPETQSPELCTFKSGDMDACPQCPRKISELYRCGLLLEEAVNQRKEGEQDETTRTTRPTRLVVETAGESPTLSPGASDPLYRELNPGELLRREDEIRWNGEWQEIVAGWECGGTVTKGIRYRRLRTPPQPAKETLPEKMERALSRASERVSSYTEEDRKRLSEKYNIPAKETPGDGTPRTDAYVSEMPDSCIPIVHADVSRALERELQSAQKVKDGLIKALDATTEQRDAARQEVEYYRHDIHNIAAALGIVCLPMQEPRFIGEKAISLQITNRQQAERIRELEESWSGLRDAVFGQDNHPCENYSLTELHANELREKVSQQSQEIARLKNALESARLFIRTAKAQGITCQLIEDQVERALADPK